LIRADVARLAARAGQSVQRRVARLQKQTRALGRTTLVQRRELARLERRVSRLRDARARSGNRTVPSGPAIKPAAVRALRAKLGMTREQFARYLGVSPGSIFLWETGRAQPRAASLARLRKVTASNTRGARVR
jgi:DNA-binding transcriptional regulator YiaG